MGWNTYPMRWPKVARPLPQLLPCPSTSGPSILDISLRMLLYKLEKSVFSEAA